MRSEYCCSHSGSFMKVRPTSIHLLILVLAISLFAGPGRATQQAPDLQSAWQAVRTGQAVIIMRHALAPGVGDPAAFDLQDCATQRNLSSQGIEQASAIGDVLRAQGVSTATVLSSQWCRCMDTARLLDLGDPEPTPMLNSFFQGRGSREEQTDSLRKSLVRWISQPDRPRILVTHQVNITALTGESAGSGDMLIVTVVQGEPRVLARIEPT